MTAQTETNWKGPSLSLESFQKAKDDLLEACGGQWPIAGLVVTKIWTHKGTMYEVKTFDTKRRYVVMAWADYYKLQEYINHEVMNSPIGIINRFSGVPIYEDEELAERLLLFRRFTKEEPAIV